MARFILALIVGLALLMWAASGVVQTTASKWFERDINSRAQLVLTGASQSLADAWFDPTNLDKQLQALAHDERVMAVAACGRDLTLLSKTSGFPDEFNCSAVGSRVRAADSIGDSPEEHLHEWSTVATLPTGRVHVSAMPIPAQGQALGFAIMVHDLSFIDRREAAARTFVIVVFGFLAVMAFGVPMLVAKRARSDWSLELRSLLRGGGKQSREFQPILSDMRELIGRMSNEREDAPGQWTAERLKQTLNRYLHGEKIVILANREPYIHQRRADGQIEIQHPASGLVTALEPVMIACSGVWIAHGAGSADRETVDRHDHVRVPPGEESYHIRRVWLSDAEQQGYYYGFANEGLWPLCHVAHARPIFRSEDWRQYRAVNQKFADAVCSEVDSKDPIILVQDYHFALAPAMIRKRLPTATVIVFWHIPWPNAEQMGICPWRNEILEGLLGSSILGFHTQLHANNFLDSVDRYLETRIDREHNAVVMQGHRTLIRPYPIALEWPVRWVETSPSPEECRAQVWRELGLKRDALLGVGVDRLDYTKGVEERLLAVELLLERHPEFRGRFSFAQLAAPSRVKIERYRDLNETVERLAERINLRFGKKDYNPIILLRSHHEPPEVFRYFRAADLCYVSSLHDGMNLVAKEFVAARTDLKGVLVLSEFTGAARELTEALIVNPYDLEGSSEALAAALTMPLDEQMDRMTSMRSLLAQFNVYRWAGKMLVDAARLRNQERVTGRLAERTNAITAV
ncbi:MAG TPA: trehalose-6-phosphate synthase [Bryobacteraceae bacterium]|nr:trehalose-6-phosphate synthase [Bryobacteraceae bacterium]